MTIAYSFGRNRHDNAPAQRSAQDLDAFLADLDAHRAPKKETAAYICGPLNGDGKRCAEGALPRRWLAVDLDRIDPDALPEVRLWFARFRGAAWPTHSSTPTAPRERAIVELDRDVDRAEAMAVGEALAADLVEEFGQAITVDPCTFRGEQPVFVPPVGVTFARFDGEPLQVAHYLRARKAPEQERHNAEHKPGEDEFAEKVAALGRKLRTGDGRRDLLKRYIASRIGRGLKADDVRLLIAGIAADYFEPRDPIDEKDVAEIVQWATEKEQHKQESEAGVPVFELLSVAEVLALPPTPWLVNDLLPARGLAVLYGEPGSGKSFLALDVAVHLARKKRWSNRRVRHAKVVYIVLEGSLRNRLDAYKKHHHLTDADLADLLTIQNTPLDLLDEATVPALVASVKQKLGSYAGELVVVVDTLARAMPGGNENASEDMGALIAACGEIERHLKALVLLVHHAGKDSTRGARGWSGLRGAADAEILCERSGDNRLATFAKVKDGADGVAVEFRLQVVDLGPRSAVDPEATDDERITSCVAVITDANAKPRQPDKVLGKNQRLLVNALRTSGPWIRTQCHEFMEQAGIGKSRRYEVIESLLTASVIEDTVAGLRVKQ